MDLKTLTINKLKHEGLYAKKGLGQNFLISIKALLKIVNAANIEPNDFILEIGPGTGNLTQLLSEKTENLLCLEKDEDFQNMLAPFPVRYIDALKFAPIELPKGYKIIANIPYYITSPLINHYLKDQFIGGGNPPKLMILLIQREVAEKICDPKYHSYLSNSIKLFGKPRIVAQVKNTAFYPPPKVHSAVLKIDVYDQPLIPVEDLENYMQTVGWLFSNPRKKISNNLKPFLGDITLAEVEEKSGVNLDLRAEKLDIMQVNSISKIIHEKN